MCAVIDVPVVTVFPISVNAGNRSVKNKKTRRKVKTYKKILT